MIDRERVCVCVIETEKVFVCVHWCESGCARERESGPGASRASSATSFLQNSLKIIFSTDSKLKPKNLSVFKLVTSFKIDGCYFWLLSIDFWNHYWAIPPQDNPITILLASSCKGSTFFILGMCISSINFFAPVGS